MEALCLQLGQDGSQAVIDAVFESLLPALLRWLAEAGSLLQSFMLAVLEAATSLLERCEGAVMMSESRSTCYYVVSITDLPFGCLAWLILRRTRVAVIPLTCARLSITSPRERVRQLLPCESPAGCKSQSSGGRDVAIVSLAFIAASSVVIEQHVLVGKQNMISWCSLVVQGGITASHGFPSCLSHVKLLCAAASVLPCSVRCPSPTSLRLSPARQPMRALQLTLVPWQSDATALC